MRLRINSVKGAILLMASANIKQTAAIIWVTLLAIGGGVIHENLMHREDGQAVPHTFRPMPRAARQTVPPSLKRFLLQAATAVNSHDLSAIKPFITPGSLSRFDWITSKTTRTWQGDALNETVFSNSASHLTYVAVFHAWHTCESDGDHVYKLENTPAGWRLGSEIPERETGGYRVRDHDLTVNVDVAKQFVMIHDKARIEIAPESRQPSCMLRLSEDFHVSALTVDNVITAFQQVGGIIVFVPPTLPFTATPALKPEVKSALKTDAAAITVGLTYAGHVDHQISDYILPNEVTLNSYWYPHIARLPATATVTVSAPMGWTAIAQGEKLQEHRNADSTTTVTYRNDIPTSFFTVDIGRYIITRRTVNGRVLSVCLLNADDKRAQQCLDLLQQSLEFFDTNFAPYPYTHYEVVETKGPLGGALEAYSFATFGGGTLPSTVVHELSHTWWGGIVPCTYTRSMWNEAFAEYSSALFGRVNQKANPKINLLLNDASKEADTVPPGKRHDYGKSFNACTVAEAHDTSDSRQETVGYDKGGLVMRVLEDEIGRPALLHCLQTFIREHPKGEAAEWQEFALAVNKTTGQDYDWFFEQWTHRKGLPRVRLAHVTTQSNAEGYEVSGDIDQEGEPYRMHLPVRLQTQDGKAIQILIEVKGERTAFHMQAKSVPARFTLDPDNTIPLNTTTEQATTILR